MSLRGLDPQVFLRDNWQREPSIFRDAITVQAPVTPEELAGLALEDHVESRVVESSGETWSRQDGPFPDDFFQKQAASGWTLLVQGVDLWLNRTQSVIDAFDFLPRWRFDDIMVSYATPGGGVGPHFDHYDVFLIQVFGQRSWRLGQTCDQEAEVDTSGGLKTLLDFQQTSEHTLVPGDILYVPPGIAHWGESIDESITYSVGFRAPTAAEMLYDLAIELESRDDVRHLTDPPLTADMAGPEIHPSYVHNARAFLESVIGDDQFIADWLARYMTRPKYQELLDLSQEQREAYIDQRRYTNGETD
ncbi:MAG: cupin domain-containing protein [Pseudomonadales bacterium]|nr:cupin domain-containing protein [Pseudomonadales bacterium]